MECLRAQNGEGKLWRNRPFYTSSRVVYHHLKSSSKFYLSNSIKPVVRRVSRRISMNQITRIDMHRTELAKELTTMITTLRNFYKHNYSFIYKPGSQIKYSSGNFYTSV